jgi:hypothetical protein
MQLVSMKAFEKRWAKLRKLASAQLKDFEKDRVQIAKAVKQHRLAKNARAAKEALLHQKRVVKVIKQTKALVATKDRMVKKAKTQARRRGKLLKRALT